MINRGTIKSKGLVAHLPLNEAGGNIAYDRSINITGVAPPSISTCLWKLTPLGTALTWASAVQNKVTIGKPSSLNLADSTMTVSCWIYVTNLGGGVNSGYRYICSDYNAAATNGQFAFQITNTKRLSFFWINSGTQAPNPTTASGATALVVNKIYHVVGVRSGKTSNWVSDVYLNGVKDGNSATTTTNPGTQANSGDVVVGQAGVYVGTPLGMVGSIKDLRIYNRALDASEIRQLYLDGKDLYIKPTY